MDPFAYLRDVLDRVCTHPARRVAELLPDRWWTHRCVSGSALAG
ncbi:transposase domain-containing protein [Paludisphaera mucosa]